MRKLIISLTTAALMAAGTVTGLQGIAQASTVHAATHLAAGPASGKVIPRPGTCGSCKKA